MTLKWKLLDIWFQSFKNRFKQYEINEQTGSSLFEQSTASAGHNSSSKNAGYLSAVNASEKKCVQDAVTYKANSNLNHLRKMTICFPVCIFRRLISMVLLVYYGFEIKSNLAEKYCAIIKGLKCGFRKRPFFVFFCLAKIILYEFHFSSTKYFKNKF